MFIYIYINTFLVQSMNLSELAPNAYRPQLVNSSTEPRTWHGLHTEWPWLPSADMRVSSNVHSLEYQGQDRLISIQK